MRELKPCPFCGGDAYVDRDNDHFAVICKKCQSCSGYTDIKQEAIQAWNARPTPDSGIEWVGECDTCNGSGYAGKIVEGETRCPKCNGTGTIARQATKLEWAEISMKAFKDVLKNT